MIGQILVYRYNGLHNAKPGVKRNYHTLIDINDKNEFRNKIIDSLDCVQAGKGYVLVKYNGKMFICEKDLNDYEKDYVRHNINYHPLQNVFTC